MFERQHLLESAETFKSLENYRNLLNKVQATADFMYDVSKELLSHAETLTIRDGNGEAQEREPLQQREAERLKAIAKARRRKRMHFFNSADDVKLRFEVPGHIPKQGPVLYCVMCGQNEGPWRGHRSSYSCPVCSVQLCIRTYPGLRKSCWSLWHSSRILKLRQTPRIAANDSNDVDHADDSNAEDKDQPESTPANTPARSTHTPRRSSKRHLPRGTPKTPQDGGSSASRPQRKQRRN